MIADISFFLSLQVYHYNKHLKKQSEKYKLKQT